MNASRSSAQVVFPVCSGKKCRVVRAVHIIEIAFAISILNF
jgi:hypothetical protein